MLGDKTVVATIAVKDMAVAKAFYEDKLGLARVNDDDPGGVLYKSGSSNLFVYQSQFAGTNQATAASWGVGEDMEAVVAELTDKGIAFETYDMPGVNHNGAIHVMGDLQSAWFKDPDGNILNIVNRM